jgi:hypothetical protein
MASLGSFLYSTVTVLGTVTGTVYRNWRKTIPLEEEVRTVM